MSVNDHGLEVLKKSAVPIDEAFPTKEYKLRVSNADGSSLATVQRQDTGNASLATIAANQNKYYDVESLSLQNIKGHEGAQHVVNYLDAIGQGKVTGHMKFRGFGERTNLSTDVTGDDVWGGTASTIPIPNQITGEQMTIVSTSIQDGVGGTGIRSLDIHYIDAAGVEQHEILLTDGTTPKNTVATNIRFIQVIHGQSWGSGKVAAGSITIYKTGSASTVYNLIPPGINVSLNSSRMVPAGKILYIKSWSVSGASNKSIIVRLRITSTYEDELITDYAFLIRDAMYLQNSAIVKDYPCPLAAPGLSIVKLTAWSSQAGGDVAASWGGWYE